MKYVINIDGKFIFGDTPRELAENIIKNEEEKEKKDNQSWRNKSFSLNIC